MFAMTCYNFKNMKTDTFKKVWSTYLIIITKVKTLYNKIFYLKVLWIFFFF
jgi:hypothetical protein